MDSQRLKWLLACAILVGCFDFTLSISSHGHGRRLQQSGNENTDGEALCAFYDTMPSSANKAKLVNWCGEKSNVGNYLKGPCGTNLNAWTAVRCQNSRVVAVDFYTSRLTSLGGSLPSQLGGLNVLSILDVTSVGLQSTIPTQLGRLTALQLLDLNTNHLSGNVPESLGNLANLRHLDLNTNKLSGKFPSIGTNLRKLYYLKASFNRFTGTIPRDFGLLTSLQYMHIAANDWSGQIPSEFGYLTNLTYLSLRNSRISGAVPSTFGNLVNLRLLHMFDTRITSLPSEMELMRSLTALELYGSRLTSFSSSLGKIYSLRTLYMDSCQIVGTVPTSIGLLTNLQSFTISNNPRLGGSLPHTVGNMKSLEKFWGFGANFSGLIPTNFGLLPKLQTLDLSGNNFVGPIPRELGGLNAITSLQLFGNRLTGSIPTEVLSLKTLTILQLQTNQLTGTLPSTLAGLSSLSWLDISSNKFFGELPVELWTMSNMVQLKLGSNKFSGQFSPQIQMPKLVTLSVELNSLGGTIPFGAAVQSLNIFKIYSNSFSGVLPPVFYSLPNLIELSVHGNRLMSTIPSSLGANLQTLNIGMNQMTGTLPSSFAANKIKIFQINGNAIYGVVPAAFCSILSLRIFNVRDNRLSGTLPSCFSKLGNLTTTILANNMFTGNNFDFLRAQRLQTIDISNNLFYGQLPTALFMQGSQVTIFAAAVNCFDEVIPNSICILSTLRVLVLDGLGSNFNCPNVILPTTGTIPRCIFSFKNLSVLHMSGNDLSGDVISTLTAWPQSLVDLSLSHNFLIGSIPYSLQRTAQQLSKLDLSYNKLNGVLNAMTVRSGDMSLKLEVNRFSGLLSQSLITSSGNVSLLEGSLINCEDRNAQLPVNDPYFAKFQCGSSTFDNYSFSFMSACGVIFAVLLYRLGATRKLLQALHPIAENQDDQVRRVLTSLHHVRYFCFPTFCVIVLMMLPLAGFLSSYQSEYTYLYAWFVSFAFKSGDLSAYMTLLAQSAFVNYIFYFLRVLTTRLSTVPGYDTIISKSNLWTRVRYLVIGIIDVAIVLVPNIGYVAVSSKYSREAQTAASLLLTIYKMLWNLVALPRILKSDMLKFGVTEAALEDETFSLLLQALNSIVVPAIAFALANSNCFSKALFPPLPISSSYPSQLCSYDIQTHTTLLGGYSAISTGTYQLNCSAVATNVLRFQPKFAYNYQCSSSFLEAYSPVFLLTTLTTTFFDPAVLFLIITGRGRLWQPLWCMLLRLAPNIIKRSFQVDDPSLKSTDILHVNDIFKGILSDFIILLSFGFYAPLLGITALASIFSRTLYWHFVIDSTALFDDDKAQLTVNCQNFNDRSHPFHDFSWYLLGFSSLFSAFFVADTSGDSDGWRGAVLLSVLSLSVPAFVAWLLLVWVAHFHTAKLVVQTPIEKHALSGRRDSQEAITLEMGQRRASRTLSLYRLSSPQIRPPESLSDLLVEVGRPVEHPLRRSLSGLASTVEPGGARATVSDIESLKNSRQPFRGSRRLTFAR